jgi:serine/threonine-protein kinase
MPRAPDLSGHALNDRYELHGLIGEGTFGRVYRGRDRRLARAVAVKVIKPWWSEDPDWARRFEREAQVLARVNDPGIVQIFDVGHAAEGIYYVAELVDGESLAARLGRGRLSPAEACELAIQLCSALAQAHAEGVVHRDVKPANVLISDAGRVKVGDFGVALLAEGSTDGTAAGVVGTPRYMAPEQAEGRTATPATDVYSVGIVVYEMLCGRPPFDGTSPVELALRHLQEPLPPLPAHVPAALEEVVLRALAKSPEERYENAGAMADALTRTMRATEGHSPPRSRATGVPARRVRGLGAAAGRASDAAATLLREGEEPPRNGGRHRPMALRTGGEHRAARTRVAPRLSPRRNFDPAGRRRTVALFSLVVCTMLAGIVGAVLLAQPSKVRVPDLRGLSKSQAATRADRAGLRPVFVTRYDQATRGTTVAQKPGRGTSLNRGSSVQVVLSAGPPPVELPLLNGESSADARKVLSSLGLHAAIKEVPAPGVSPGTVTAQSPSSAAEVLTGSTVVLSVAETPEWRPITSFNGDGAGRSVPFRIRGTRWRIVYNMGYQGVCTFIFFCSGPSAHIAAISGGSPPNGFDLNEGQSQIQQFASGPGVYQVTVSPGSDTAHWSMEIEDDY